MDQKEEHQPVFFGGHDAVQLLVGALLLAIPMAFTGEVWDLGKTLAPEKVIALAIVSLTVLALFNWGLFYQGHIGRYRLQFAARVASSYLVTLGVALLLLILIDMGPEHGWGLATKRAVIIAFPASFAATAVDYMK